MAVRRGPQDDLSVGWYVLMKQGNVYRLQHDRAFTAYAQSPEARIRIQLDRALEAWNWFAGMTLPSVFEDEIHPEDSQWAYYRGGSPRHLHDAGAAHLSEKPSSPTKLWITCSPKTASTGSLTACSM